MSHPACCKDPDCQLSYVDHLRGFIVGAAAQPSRVNRTPGQPDEPLSQTAIRDKRWDRDAAAYERLRKDGLHPPRVDGSAMREREGKTEHDIERRPVTIDYKDAS